MNLQMQEEILEWVRTVKFKRKLIGGVDYEDVLKKMEELTRMYEAVLLSERIARNSSFTNPEEGGKKHD